MPVNVLESTDENNPKEKQYSIVKQRLRRDIRPPQKYIDLVVCALSVAKEIDGVSEPTTYSTVVSCDDFAK